MSCLLLKKAGEAVVGPRMLCTECFETSQPATLLPGSDRLELLAWLCLALPGWLYCAGRHALRVKACGVCGGSALVREARAAALRARGPERPVTPTRSLAPGGSLRWPRSFSTPRERLRAGAPAALAASAATLGAGLFAAGLVPSFAAGVVLAVSSAAVAGCLARGAQVWRRSRARLAGCRAWLHDGREIHIELA